MHQTVMVLKKQIPRNARAASKWIKAIHSIRQANNNINKIFTLKSLPIFISYNSINSFTTVLPPITTAHPIAGFLPRFA